MLSIKNFRTFWNEFFFSTTDGSNLAIFRIVLGLIFFLNGLSFIEDFHSWFGVGNESLVPLADSFRFYGEYRLNIFKILAPTNTAAWFVLGGYITFSLLFMIGLKTKLSSIILFILMVSLQNRNYAILNSGDTVMRCLLFAMLWAPCGNLYSVDSYLSNKSGHPLSKKIPVLGVRFIQIQFSIVYLATTLFKLKGIDWVDGTAIYYTSRLENFQRVVLPIIFDHLFLVKIMTWSALFIEFAMGTLVWIKELRIPVLLAGIALHIGIELTMSIGFFEWVMFAGYIVFFKKSDFKFFLKVFRKYFEKRPSEVNDLSVVR